MTIVHTRAPKRRKTAGRTVSPWRGFSPGNGADAPVRRARAGLDRRLPAQGRHATAKPLPSLLSGPPAVVRRAQAPLNPGPRLTP